jgi:hypothetical protein
MNIIFQHEPVFAIRLRDQTPSIGMAQKAARFRGTEMRPERIRPLEVLLRVDFRAIYSGNSQEFQLMSTQLLLHPMKSLNIFIKVYDVNIQNAFLNNSRDNPVANRQELALFVQSMLALEVVEITVAPS